VGKVRERVGQQRVEGKGGNRQKRVDIYMRCESWSQTDKRARIHIWYVRKVQDLDNGVGVIPRCCLITQLASLHCPQCVLP